MFSEETRSKIIHLECLALLILIVLFAFFSYYLPSRQRRIEALEREHALEMKINNSMQEKKALEEKCSLLEVGEPQAVEQAIRERLGWGRDGEVLMALPEKFEKAPNQVVMQ